MKILRVMIILYLNGTNELNCDLFDTIVLFGGCKLVKDCVNFQSVNEMTELEQKLQQLVVSLSNGKNVLTEKCQVWNLSTPNQ